MFDVPLEIRNLLHKYQRLLRAYNTKRVELPLSVIAVTLSCTPRYARTLLSRMQAEGWVLWSTKPGRGALGHLECRLDVAALQSMKTRDFVLREKVSDIKNESRTTSQIKGYHYKIEYYRPLMPLIPSVHLARAERHLLQMVHAGLTRWTPGNSNPVPGLAHTIRISEDGLVWTFNLRRGLIWHNGEAANTEQLRQIIESYIGSPGLPYVICVSAQKYKIRLHLSQPDYRLAQRLANPIYALAHPDNRTCGLGPFRVHEHTDQKMVLKRFINWYGEKPQASEVVYETTLQSESDWSSVRLLTPDSQLLSEKKANTDTTDSFLFLTFNRKDYKLNIQQINYLHSMIKTLVTCLKNNPGVHSLPDWLLIKDKFANEVTLPHSISMAYFRTKETEFFVSLLKKNLRYRNCSLKLTAVNDTHWLLPTEIWADKDMYLGYLLSEPEVLFSFEERYRHSAMLQKIWPDHLQYKINILLDRYVCKPQDEYLNRVKRMVRYGVRHSWITPLWSHKHKIEYPESVHIGVLYSQCWPDFTQIWTDAEIMPYMIDDSF